MERIIIKFGLLSGFILAVLTSILVPLCMNDAIPFQYGAIVGYASMVLCFTLVFFGIKSYRDNLAGGTITFGRAFMVGILTALVTCAVYVIGWQIVFWNFVPDFADKYAAVSLEQMRASGKSAADIAAAEKDMEWFKKNYKNPLFNIGVTFMEVFPVGLIVTLVSAAILRRRAPGSPQPATALA